MSLTTDYHMHTPLCQHASGPIEAYVETAIELGLRQIGFSCHNPLPRGLGADVRMKESELEYYVQRILDLQFQYHGRISILLGLEMDYVEGTEDYLTRQVAAHPWDYILGSIHYLDRDCQLLTWSRHLPFDAEEQYTRYCTLMRKLIATGLCDIISHFDVPKRSAHLPGPRGTDELRHTLEEIARANLCMEINTSGYRHKELLQTETYPSPAWIEQALALGIPLVVNSDAHAPRHVGTMFTPVEALLRQKGCRQLVTFERRQRRAYDF
jgi:histidinol-phosphatase (PHP family)